MIRTRTIWTVATHTLAALAGCAASGAWAYRVITGGPEDIVTRDSRRVWDGFTPTRRERHLRRRGIDRY